MATKEKKKRPPRSKRPKQTYIEGTAPPSIPEIDEAADAYRDARDSRMEMLKDETKCQDALSELMHKHNLTTYEYEGYVVSMKAKEKVSVKRKPGANGEASVE